MTTQMATTDLVWRQEGADWVLRAGRRLMGRVTPDLRYPGMWRPVLSGGRRGDMANLSWARSTVLAAAEMELEYVPPADRPPPEMPGKEGGEAG